ncbi:hypothetical protein BOTBODRAFT_339374 [Botryobasidium botryosum FD-172 SS1]|uniref:Uncharacterized protein n=1 Tax=Botryobasidium botryosum (strain FD-172 SS1) TaxID=930990 RepID=A0A067MGT6_BOTB1|nr:hypothetical protein BOTBODRAFT_339374 [Botryobasidium botryosum FD-172 SS1]
MPPHKSAAGWGIELDIQHWRCGGIYRNKQAGVIRSYLQVAAEASSVHPATTSPALRLSCLLYILPSRLPRIPSPCWLCQLLASSASALRHRSTIGGSRTCSRFQPRAPVARTKIIKIALHNAVSHIGLGPYGILSVISSSRGAHLNHPVVIRKFHES